MSPALIALGILAYLVLAKPAQTAYRTGSVAPATATSTPAATTITIPGFGSYQNVYGGGVSIALNPQLLAGLFNTPTSPAPDAQLALAAPDAGYQYVPELAITGGYSASDLALPVYTREAQ